MPNATTYSGVYIEALSTSVRAMTGVAASIRAFSGWAPKGRTDRAGLVPSRSGVKAASRQLEQGARAAEVSQQIAATLDGGIEGRP